MPAINCTTAECYSSTTVSCQMQLMGSARQPLIDLLLVTQLQLARCAVRGLDHDCAGAPVST